jgi:hypothetical protein
LGLNYKDEGGRLRLFRAYLKAVYRLFTCYW